MNAIINLGKYLFAAPFAIFGIMHFMAAGEMAAMAPFGGVFMIYFTGLAHIAAAVSIIIGKYDKLASFLLGIMLLLFIIPHAGNMSNDESEMFNILKNLVMAGGAWIYAASAAKDDSVIG